MKIWSVCCHPFFDIINFINLNSFWSWCEWSLNYRLQFYTVIQQCTWWIAIECWAITLDCESIGMFQLPGNTGEQLINVFMGVPNRKETKLHLSIICNMYLLLELMLIMNLPFWIYLIQPVDRQKLMCIYFYCPGMCYPFAHRVQVEENPIGRKATKSSCLHEYHTLTVYVCMHKYLHPEKYSQHHGDC